MDFAVVWYALPAGDYRKRYYNIKTVYELDQPHIKYVEHMAIQDEEHLFSQLDKIALADGEGVMLRKVSSRYQAGRGRIYLLKRFADTEAQVIGHKPGTGRLLGMMGAILFECLMVQSFILVVDLQTSCAGTHTIRLDYHI